MSRTEHRSILVLDDDPDISPLFKLGLQRKFGSDVFYSNSIYYDSNNPFIIGIMLWQAYGIAWINGYNEFLKSWADNIKIDSNEFNIRHPVAMSLSKEMKNILGHIVEMSECNPANGVYDTAIITQSGLSKDEVYNCLVQLERLNLIKLYMKWIG